MAGTVVAQSVRSVGPVARLGRGGPWPPHPGLWCAAAAGSSSQPVLAHEGDDGSRWPGLGQEGVGQQLACRGSCRRLPHQQALQEALQQRGHLGGDEGHEGRGRGEEAETPSPAQL